MEIWFVGDSWPIKDFLSWNFVLCFDTFPMILSVLFDRHQVMVVDLVKHLVNENNKHIDQCSIAPKITFCLIVQVNVLNPSLSSFIWIGSLRVSGIIWRWDTMIYLASNCLQLYFYSCSTEIPYTTLDSASSSTSIGKFSESLSDFSFALLVVYSAGVLFAWQVLLKIIYKNIWFAFFIHGRLNTCCSRCYFRLLCDISFSSTWHS